METAEKVEYALPRRFDLEIQGYDENVYLVRSLVDQAAESWRLSGDVRDTGRLVLTELTTNAVRIYRGRTVKAWVADPGGGGLEMGVWDPGPGDRPRLLPAPEDAVCGRGLWLVHELSERRWGWYVSETTNGKVVWATVGP